MPLSPYFLQGSQGEQRLVQDLINEQLNIQKDLMTLNIRKDYVLTYIDSPNTPVDKYSPRLLFHILASIIISILYLMAVLIFFED